MREKTGILILIEHTARELESAVLLKLYLEKCGNKVVIDTVSQNKEEIVLKYDADIVFVPWAYHKRDMDLYRNLSHDKKRPIFINFHHEQFTNPGSMKWILPSGEARKIMHLSWGDSFSNGLRQVGCPEETICQCGNIRLDFFKERFKGYSLKRGEIVAKYEIPENKKWILYIANSFHLLTQTKRESMKKEGVDAEVQIECSITNRKYFFQYVEQALCENKDVVFIYRPHPSYAFEDQQDEMVQWMLKKYPKQFFCISELAIRDWILNVDVCISFHSTAAIECSIANVPFYLFRVDSLENDKDYPFFYQYPYTISDFERFAKVLSLTDNYDNEVLKKRMKPYLYSMDCEVYSVDKIIEYIERIKRKEIYCDSIEPNISAYLKCFLKMYIKKIIVLMAKSRKIKEILLSKKDPRFLHILNMGDDCLSAKKINEIELRMKPVLEEGNTCL